MISRYRLVNILICSYFYIINMIDSFYHFMITSINDIDQRDDYYLRNLKSSHDNNRESIAFPYCFLTKRQFRALFPFNETSISYENYVRKYIKKPTSKQTINFIDFFYTNHSWYKHITKDTIFCFYLSRYPVPYDQLNSYININCNDHCKYIYYYGNWTYQIINNNKIYTDDGIGRHKNNLEKIEIDHTNYTMVFNSDTFIDMIRISQPHNNQIVNESSLNEETLNFRKLMLNKLENILNMIYNDH